MSVRMRRSSIVFVLVLFSLVISACGIGRRELIPTFTPIPSATLPPIPTETPVVIVPTVQVIIVTLPPPATATPRPSATVPYDMVRYNGNWLLSLEVNVLGLPRFNNVRYVGVGQLSVTPEGNVTGRITFSTRADQPLCSVAIRSKPLDASISGKLDLGEDGHVYAFVTLRPDDLMQATQFEMLCEKPVYETIRTENILWPALQAVRDLKLVFPVESGYTDTNVADLTGPTGGLLNGSVRIQTELSR